MPEDEPPQRPGRRGGVAQHRVEVRCHVRRVPLSPRHVESLAAFALRAEGAGQAWLSIELCGRQRMARVHHDVTGVSGPTDVVSLEHDRSGIGAPLVGEIWIAPEIARRNAARLGVSPREEVARLVIHGVLHVLGGDHPVGDARETSPMWRRQEQLLRRAQRAGVV